MGTTAQKLNRVLQTKSDLKTVINYSGANITNETTFKDYPKLLNKAYIDILNDEGESLYNALPKTIETGTSINLDVEKGKMKIDLKSTQIEQVSTSGNNLIKFPNIAETTVNGITYSIQDDVISLNGTATDNIRYIYASNFAFDGAGDYRITLISISGNYTSGVIGISSRSEDKTQQIVWQQVADRATTNKKSYTASNITAIKNIGMYINSGTVINNLKFKFMFTKGDNIPTTYENMDSPTPDYPQDIHIITGSNSIKIQNKNLFDKDNASYFKAYISVGSRRIVAGNDDRTIYIKCKPNTTYTIQKMVQETTSRNRFVVGTTSSIPQINDGMNDFHYYDGGTTNTTLTLTTGPIANYLCVFCWSIDSVTTFEEILDSIQIEEGSTPTNYVEHQEQNYPISLGDLEYCKIGSNEDQIFKNTTDSEFYDSTLLENEWYLKKKIGKEILNGSENWTNNETVKRLRLILPQYVGNTSNNSLTGYLTNYFTEITPGQNWGKNEGFCFDMVSALCIWNNYASSEDLTGFKNWLSSHNLLFYGVLKTPQNTQITDTELIQQLENIYHNAKSYEGVTHITQTNDDLPFNLEVSALAKIE